MNGCLMVPKEFIELYRNLQRCCQSACEDEVSLFEEIQRSLEQAQRVAEDHAKQRDNLLELKKKISSYQDIAIFGLGGKVQKQADYPETAPDILSLQKILGKMHAGLPGGDALQLYEKACGQIKGIDRKLKQLESDPVPENTGNMVQEFREKQCRDLTWFFNSKMAVMQNDRTISMEEGVLHNIPIVQDGRSRGNCAGMLSVNMPTPQNRSGFVFDAYPVAFRDDRLSVPLEFNLSRGSCTFVGYNQDTENQFIALTKRLLVQAADNLDQDLEQILFIDPYRMSGDVLGNLTEAVRKGEKNMFSIPESRDEIKSSLKEFLNVCKFHDRKILRHYRICVLMGYPNEYQGDLKETIRQLCFNAAKYKLIILMGCPFSEKGMPADFQLPFNPDIIRSEGRMLRFRVPEISGLSEAAFFAPEEQDITDVFFSRSEKKEELDNRYEKCIQDFTSLQLDSRFGYRYKGKEHKTLSDLPYAITTDGKQLLKTDFEGTQNFGFVYGVTRSGKSTFLHALITSMILNMHPDDVEIWLVDFKMTEFNRYIRFCPPQVRYILLEDSREMVCDLIDRLMEVYNKRRTRFSANSWIDMRDVPAEEYLTSVFVIIDEFNVMSSILNQAGEESYRGKLEFLITKAAAFGIHILFSSQNFSSGLAGLSETAKGNLGWRAALSGTHTEKAETLALSHQTERDSRLVSTLKPHHVLVKRQADESGNQLDYGKVLFFSTVEDQVDLINLTKSAVEPVKLFEPDNLQSYVFKRPEFYDGHKYVSFSSQHEAMQARMLNQQNDYDRFISLFPGQPRRMRVVQEIELRPIVGENLLVVGNPEQAEDMTSMILSIVRSCELDRNNCDIAILVKGAYKPFVTAAELAEKGKIPDEVIFNNDSKAAKYLKRLCSEAREGTNRETLVFLLDYLEFIQTEEGTHRLWQDDFEMDLTSVEDAIEDTKDIDPANEIEWLLQNGSPHGCHVISMLKSSYELKRARISSDVYRHRIFFSAARDDAVDYVKKGEARYIESMPTHTFRYSNEQEAVSYRPYIHPGIAVDGYVLDGKGEVIKIETQDKLQKETTLD